MNSLQMHPITVLADLQMYPITVFADQLDKIWRHEIAFLHISTYSVSWIQMYKKSCYSCQVG